MTGPIWLQIGLGILTLLGLGVSGYATYRTSTRAKQIESQAAPYGTLAERVGRLETQVGDLLASQHEDRMYIRILIAERPPGRPLPQPVPITEQVYDGIGKLQTYEAYEQSGTAGPATTQTQRMTLHLPVGSYMPHPGDIATCTASSDPLLVGRRMRIAQVMPSKEHATAYRCFVDETTQGA